MVARHPAVQRRLYDECLEILGDRVPIHSDIPKLRSILSLHLLRSPSFLLDGDSMIIYQSYRSSVERFVYKAVKKCHVTEDKLS